MMVHNKKKVEEIIDKVITKEVYEFFTEFLPSIGFEEREGQQDMSLDICEAMRDDEHIMVEAGVGIGKSYAYLLPLMIYNREFKEPIVVSTSTISLQEQLMDDIRALSKMMNYFPEITLAKGMSHFSCSHRIDEFGGRAIFENDKDKIMKYEELKKWSLEVGDRALLKEDIEAGLWEQINVKHCLFNKCKYYKECVFIKKRDRMANSDGIILCNHDLLIVDANKKNRNERPLLTEKIQYIVIDEGHNLEEKARSVLQDEITYRKCFSALEEGKFFFKKAGKRMYCENLQELSMNMEVYFKILSEEINLSMKQGEFQGTEMSKFSFRKNKTANITRKMLKQIDQAIKDTVSIEIGSRSEYDYFESYQDELIDEFKRIKDIIYNIQYDSVDTLTWGEFSGKKAQIDNVKIVAAPKFIDRAIGRLFFKNKKNDFEEMRIPKVIVTSATLTDKKEGEIEELYSYMEKNIGFPWRDGRGIISEPKESPFDYEKNTMVYYRNNMPHPMKEKEEYRKKAVEEIAKLLDVTGGKTLILFSAKEDLRWTYNELMTMNLPYRILKQSSQSSQEKIVSEFKENENSVLLGTGVFWEGINLPGKTLSQVIIFRLPFSVPDPIIEYKRGTVENPLMEVNVPEMIIKFRQGAGRLIRSSNDTGIISILDPRAGEDMKMEYREVIWDALWDCRKTKEIEQLRVFSEEKIIGRKETDKKKTIRNETYEDFTLNKYFNTDNLIKIHQIKCSKEFEVGCLKIREWIKDNKNNINSKTSEMACIFEEIYMNLVSGYSNESIDKIGKSILNEIEKARRKMIIWKRKRINIREEQEILEGLDLLQKLAKHKKNSDFKFKIYKEAYKNTHKVLLKDHKEIEMYGECFVHKGLLEDVGSEDEVVMFQYSSHVIEELLSKGVKCSVLIYDFERDMFIKEKR